MISALVWISRLGSWSERVPRRRGGLGQGLIEREHERMERVSDGGGRGCSNLLQRRSAVVKQFLTRDGDGRERSKTLLLGLVEDFQAGLVGEVSSFLQLAL